MDRRNMMMMAGLGFLAATMPLAPAQATPLDRVPKPEQPPSGDPGGGYIFQDEFDGPAGSAPDRAKWIVQTWQDDVYPPVQGIYRDDRRNVFLDGNSNLVLLATHDMGTYYSGKLRGIWRSMINQTWEARITAPFIAHAMHEHVDTVVVAQIIDVTRFDRDRGRAAQEELEILVEEWTGEAFERGEQNGKLVVDARRAVGRGEVVDEAPQRVGRRADPIIEIEPVGDVAARDAHRLDHAEDPHEGLAAAAAIAAGSAVDDRARVHARARIDARSRVDTRSRVDARSAVTARAHIDARVAGRQHAVERVGVVAGTQCENRDEANQTHRNSM